MQLKGLPGVFYRAGRLRLQEPSAKAKERLRALELWEALRSRAISSVECSSILKVPRSTIYRWRGRLRAFGPCGLEDSSRAPRRRRRPDWHPDLVSLLLRLRSKYPRWGKDTLVILVRRRGWHVSTSTVGRILTNLRRRGLLVEPPRRKVSARKRSLKRPYATRKPRGYVVKQPGDLVQLDTLDVRPLPGLVLKQFTARDVVSRWDVLDVYTRATAHTATDFLGKLKMRMPFPIKGIQVDGGSEFMAQFEEACQREGIQLFVLPPRSPKLNGHVERANRTHTEEFWECYDGDLDLPSVRQALHAWEGLYNHFRPHQGLAGKTPAEYLAECHPEMAPKAPTVSYVVNEYTSLTTSRGE